MNQIQRLIEEVLFEVKPSTEVTCVPRHPRLKRAIYRLVNTFAYDDFTEFELLNSSVTHAWEALNSFTLEKGANWTDVVEGRDEHNLNRVIKAIITKLEHELPLIVNPNTKRMYDAETGGKMYVTINFDSMDRPVYDQNGTQIGLLGDFETKSTFAVPDEPLVETPFLKWFREHRHEFLTRRQNEFINSLSTGLLKKDSDYIDENDFEQLAGMKPRDLDRIKKRIHERTLKAWEKYQADNPKSTRRGATLGAKAVLLSEFITIADSDEGLGDQNVRLSEWLCKHDDDVSDLIHDAFAGYLKATQAYSELMKGNTRALDSAVLYRVYDVILTEIERLDCEIDSLNTPVSLPWVNNMKRAENAERKAKYREFTKTQPCLVYNADGEFLREETSKVTEYKVVELNAYGMTYDTRENNQQ